MTAFPKRVETLQRDRAMSKDTGELIFKKSINLSCQPIFSYISSFVFAPNAPFSQSMSHITIYIYISVHTEISISMVLVSVGLTSLAQINSMLRLYWITISLSYYHIGHL